MEIHVIDVPKDDYHSIYRRIDNYGKDRLKTRQLEVGDNIKLQLSFGPKANLVLIDKQWVVGNDCYRLWTVRTSSISCSYTLHSLLYRMYRGWVPFRNYDMDVYGQKARLVRFGDSKPTGRGHCAFCGSQIGKDEPVMQLIFASHQRPGFSFNKTQFGGEWICKQNVHAQPHQCGPGSTLLNRAVVGR
jgi:hypothetical protein